MMLKDLRADPASLSRQEYSHLSLQDEQEYTNIWNAVHPDSSRLSRAGTKAISWHGYADEYIPPYHARDIYKAVIQDFESNKKAYRPLFANRTSVKESPDPLYVSHFYRLYELPSTKHWFGGYGPHAATADDSAGALDLLIALVENGKAPDALHGVSDVEAGESEGRERIRRPLCMWRERPVWKGDTGADWRDEEGWVCEGRGGE